jgi:hypothetical protein
MVNNLRKLVRIKDVRLSASDISLTSLLDYLRGLIICLQTIKDKT